MQASVAAQLGFHRGQIRSPLGFINATLVLLHPGQQILDIAQGHVIQLGPDLHAGLLGGLSQAGLGSSDGSLQAKVVIAAQVHQALVEAVNPVEVKNKTSC